MKFTNTFETNFKLSIFKIRNNINKIPVSIESIKFMLIYNIQKIDIFLYECISNAYRDQI